MAGFIIRRVLWTVPVLVLATFISFAMVKGLPYEKDIFASNPKFSDVQVQSLRELYGLNDPYLVQYVKFLGDLVTFDLGGSSAPAGARRFDAAEVGALRQREYSRKSLVALRKTIVSEVIRDCPRTPATFRTAF